MNNCKACSRKNEPCQNNSIPLSKYCFIHQDPSSWIIGSVIGIIVAFLVVIYQDRNPNINVKCFLVDSGDPSKICCEIVNSGRAEARDITISFNNILLKDTIVIAEPELNFELIVSDTIPNPLKYPERAKIMTAFIIKAPRVSADDRVKFTVATTNIDNLRAAKQVLKILEHTKKVLTVFHEKVREKHPDETSEVVIKDILEGIFKKENFFYPAKFSYENGRFPVDFINEREKNAAALHQDIYIRYKKDFLEVFKGGPEFKAPVIRIMTSEGESTMASMLPYISSYVEGSFPFSELIKRGEMWIQPPVPNSYD